MMYVDCKCGQEVKAADHVAGTLRKCPRCGEKVQFPPNPEEARRNPAPNAASAPLPLRSDAQPATFPLPTRSIEATGHNKLPANATDCIDTAANPIKPAIATCPPMPAATEVPRLSIASQLLRFVFVIVFFIAAQILTAFSISFGTYRYVYSVGYFVLGVALFVGCALLVNRQILGNFGRVKPRYLSLLAPVLSTIAAIVFYRLYEIQAREVWEWLTYLSALVAVVMGLVYLAGAKSFRWTAFGVAFITVSAALTVFEYRPVTSVLAAAKTSARRPAFKSLVSEVSTFATSSECRGGLDAATDKPRYFAQASQVQGNLLVVGFEDQIGRSFEDHIGHMVFVHSPSYIEGYLPPSLLAQQPSDVRLIAIVQAIHPEFTGKESPLVMESVLYRWPDRTLIASAKLEIGCTTKHRGFQVFPAAAKALHNFMDTALKESANPANVSKPVERLTVGMTLDEVQAILGKGSCYADLDLTHVDLGFSIEDPELQHNTYVWIQPADNSNISVTFKRGRLVHSFSRLPPPK